MGEDAGDEEVCCVIVKRGGLLSNNIIFGTGIWVLLGVVLVFLPMTTTFLEDLLGKLLMSPSGFLYLFFFFKNVNRIKDCEFENLLTTN